MSYGRAPVCLSCVHMNAVGLACTAFPEGIPDVILEAHADHTTEVEGDQGIRFEQDPTKPVPDPIGPAKEED